MALEYGPYKSQSEAVFFAIEAAEKLNEHGEKAQVVIIGPTSIYDQDTRSTTRTSVAGRGELGVPSRQFVKLGTRSFVQCLTTMPYCGE